MSVYIHLFNKVQEVPDMSKKWVQSVQCLYSTNSDQRRDNLAEWHEVHTVLPATHTFNHEWNEPPCIHFVSIHQMASPEQGGTHLDQLTTQFIDPKRMKGWVGLVGYLWRTCYLHKWPPVSYRSSVGQGKFVGQRLAFYHCVMQPTKSK